MLLLLKFDKVFFSHITYKMVQKNVTASGGRTEAKKPLAGFSPYYKRLNYSSTHTCCRKNIKLYKIKKRNFSKYQHFMSKKQVKISEIFDVEQLEKNLNEEDETLESNSCNHSSRR